MHQLNGHMYVYSLLGMLHLLGFLLQKIRLQEQFPNYQITKFYLDNVGEFTSQAFDDYCISIEIDVKHLVTHTHT